MKIYCEIDFHIFPIMKTIRLSLSLSLVPALCWKYLIISMQMKNLCCFGWRLLIMAVYYDKLCGRCVAHCIMLI